MDHMENALANLQAKKIAFEAALQKKRDLDTEKERLASLLDATKVDMNSCIDERREYIANGGDVFDNKTKRLRKSEQESGALIDDLEFSIEALNKRSEDILFELTSLRIAARGARSSYINALVRDLLDKVLISPPVELLMAAHLMAAEEIKTPFSFEAQRMSLLGHGSYEDMMRKKLGDLFQDCFSHFAAPQFCDEHLDVEIKQILSIDDSEKLLSPARINFIRKSREKGDQKILPELYRHHPELLGPDIDIRANNLVAL